MIQKIKQNYSVYLTVLSMPLIAVYLIFMNKPTIFRDLYFFTILFAVSSMNMVELSKKVFDKKHAISYILTGVFWIGYLVIIYISAFSDNLVEYFNKSASDKWGFAVAVFALIILIAIKIFYTNDTKNAG